MLDMTALTREDAERILRRACGDIMPKYGDVLTFYRTGRFIFHPTVIWPMKNIDDTDSPYLLEEGIVAADASGGAVVVNLPPVNHKDGHLVGVKRSSGPGSSVSVVPFGTETIDGAASKTLIQQWASILLIGDASLGGWLIISET